MEFSLMKIGNFITADTFLNLVLRIHIFEHFIQVYSLSCLANDIVKYVST